MCVELDLVGLLILCTCDRPWPVPAAHGAFAYVRLLRAYISHGP